MQRADEVQVGGGCERQSGKAVNAQRGWREGRGRAGKEPSVPSCLPSPAQWMLSGIPSWLPSAYHPFLSPQAF